MESVKRVLLVPFEKKPRVVWVISCILIVDLGTFDMVSPLVPVYKDEMDLSDLEVGIFFSIYSVAAMFATFIAGTLADLTGHLKIWISASTGILVLVSIGFAFAPNFGVLVACRVLQGFASGVSWTMAVAYILRPFANNFATLVGLVQSAGSIGSIVSPLLCGWIYEATDEVMVPCLVWAGVCAAADLLTIVALPVFSEAELQLFDSNGEIEMQDMTQPPDKDEKVEVTEGMPKKDPKEDGKTSPTKEQEKSDEKQTKDSKERRVTLRDLLSNPLTWGILLVSVACMLQIGFIYASLPVYMDEELNANSGLIGTIYSCSVVAVILASVVTGIFLDTWKISEPLFLFFGGLVGSILPLIMTQLESTAVFAVLFVIELAAVQVTMLSPFGMYANLFKKLAKEKGCSPAEASQSYGKAFGAFFCSYFLGYSLAMVVSILWEHSGYMWAYLCTAIVLTASIIIAVLLWINDSYLQPLLQAYKERAKN
ncbi:MFS transporter, DHA1 family, solute carrier family 18 (vesicular acetylcholine transporter) [Pelomyxa schiedti]|nr:MFS transporter, DHA1 family, solute carrier family 18 (vesicular acetylcholine transporter) [Pelomyxa schiedti]